MKSNKMFLAPALFKYGYSQIGHKLQGCECDSIVMVVPHLDRLRSTSFGRRYAYTAITRARKKVFVTELPSR